MTKLEASVFSVSRQRLPHPVTLAVLPGTPPNPTSEGAGLVPALHHLIELEYKSPMRC